MSRYWTCLHYNFKECFGGDVPLYADVPCKYGDDEREDGTLNKSELIFDFLFVPSFVTIFSGNQNKPRYFFKVT